MKRLFALLAALAGGLAAPAAAQESAPVEVMIFGTYHFANPGLDTVNMEVDDVLADHRQAEIAAIVDALAEWRPDRVLVENEAPPPDFRLARFAEFGPEMLGETRDESVQIGFRLAARLGHDAVYGFDERGGEDDPDYFPMNRVSEFAEAHDMQERLQGLFAIIENEVAEQEAAQATHTLPQLLAVHNDPEIVLPMHRALYYGLLEFGDGDDQPGAELNAYWYMRNAKMFSKLQNIARPGERVFVLVGSGHSYWLRHFVEETPGYELVEPMPFLDRAAAMLSAGGD